MKQKNCKTIYVEGNVGVGKTTFLQFIQQEYTNARVLYEPHERWQNVEGENLLEKFFLDQKRWAFTLQLYVIMTHVQQLQQAEKNMNHDCSVQFVERSVFSGKHCFAKALHQIGALSTIEKAIYQQAWDHAVLKDVVQPAGFIYLQADVTTVYERIKNRSRSEEEPISKEYLQLLHDAHEEWLIEKKDFEAQEVQVPVLVLEHTQDFLKDGRVQQEYCKKIETFIQNLP